MDLRYLQDLLFEFQIKVKHPRACIAGGAVRDVLLGREPRDIDIFTLGAFPMEEDIRRFMQIPQKDEDENRTDYQTRMAARQVITGYHEGYKIQVVEAEENSEESLLKRFDWNICLFAIKRDGVPLFLETPTNIGAGKALRLNCMNTPRHSLQRGVGFCDRYFMRMTDETIATLIDAAENEEFLEALKKNEKLLNVLN